MDNKNHILKEKHGNSILLLTVLIGFCILAIIEILYGQSQIRMERARLALEEENHRAVKELKAEWNDLKEGPSTVTESVPEVGEEPNSESGPEETLVDTDETELSASVSENSEDDRTYDMQIVFLGDSILDSSRDETGVAYLVGQECNAKVYNMAIGGTTAALLPDEHYNYEEWESRGLLGVVNAIVGNIEPDIFDGSIVGEVLETCDFSKTDYFVIEYGINDFLCGQIPQSRHLENGELRNIEEAQTYVGALEIAVNILRNWFPDAKILLISPHYCQIFEGSTFIGDAYSLNYGYGTLVDFFRITGYVALEYQKDNVMFFNAMEESGINAYTADEWLEDGVHLSEQGRREYASIISRRILKDFYPEE